MKQTAGTWKDYAAAKIKDVAALVTVLEPLREQGKTVATLNGSFDLLHAGHMYIIYEAAQTADILVIALNTDASVRKYKSPTRPIIPLQERMEMIAACGVVDFVSWFDETDPRAFLQQVRPDVHVNGIEYGYNCIEANVVAACGGKLHLVERIPGLATSQIIAKICDEITHQTTKM